MWKRLRKARDYKGPPTFMASAETYLTDDLNIFFARLDASSRSEEVTQV